MLNPIALVSLPLIALILAGVAVGRYPWLRMNRATIAFAGSVLLIIIGSIPLEEAFASIDMNTMALLFAMMVLNVNLRLSGFFNLVVMRVLHWARTPSQLLGLIILASGFFSAIFLNDTIVLIFTPLVVEVTLLLKRRPVPYLIGLVAGANIGSAATITGNPQNMLIGISSGIPFLTFSAHLLPVSLIGLGLSWLVLVLLYRDEFRSQGLETPTLPPHRTYPPLLRKSILAAGLMVLAFLLGAPIPLAAMAAAAVLLVTRRLKPQRVFQELDLNLLVFFASLFVVTEALNTTGITSAMFSLVKPIAESGIAALAGVALVLSNLVSNVPAVLLFRPFIPSFSDPQHAWLTLAMATTLAGNLTLLGSVANLIVAESARSRGIHLSFGEYLKSGVPITLLTILAGVIWLVLQG
jgi:Na+/H+ antiporter NhaD/arsenite permease-like protein